MRSLQHVCVVVFCIALFGVACSDDSKDSPEDTAGSGAGAVAGSAGTSGASGGGTGGMDGAGTGAAGTSAPIDGPAITSAPPAWVRPADCGGVGEMCEILSCGTRSICQSIGDLCVPQLIEGSFPPKSEEHPYCAAFTCMTFDEASCFCTGPAGKSEAACSSPAALAGLCVGAGYACSETACCDGLSCLHDANGGKVCEQTCKESSECESDCCTDPRDTGDQICTRKAACDNPCKKRGDTTCDPGSATTPTDCCRGTCVQSQNADWAGCRPVCTTDEQCDTGCCLPFNNQSYGECVDAKWCTCLEVGAVCGIDSRECCEDAGCVGDTDTESHCVKKCTDASQCAENCCVQITGADYKACLAPKYCGM